jgi:hypothetical protein
MVRTSRWNLDHPKIHKSRSYQKLILEKIWILSGHFCVQVPFHINKVTISSFFGLPNNIGHIYISEMDGKYLILANLKWWNLEGKPGKSENP